MQAYDWIFFHLHAYVKLDVFLSVCLCMMSASIVRCTYILKREELRERNETTYRLCSPGPGLGEPLSSYLEVALYKFHR